MTRTPEFPQKDREYGRKYRKTESGKKMTAKEMAKRKAGTDLLQQYENGELDEEL